AGRDLYERPGRGGAQLRQRRQLSGSPVHAVLDHLVAGLDFLDPGGDELEQLREHHLGLLAPDADREPDHEKRARARQPPKARRSLPNTPSPVRRLWSVRELASCSVSSRWSRLS